MNRKSKSSSAILNSSVGILTQIVTIFTSFIVRTVFIRYLSAEYLGVNGLYSNVLSLLSLSELGISNVMTFLLYKPLVTRDNERVLSLLKFFRKVYILIACFVLVVGVSIIPFLRVVTKSNLEQRELVSYYLLFLLGSVLSYFAVYKSIIINADQRVYVTKIVKLCANILKDALQIIVLIITKKYLFFLIVYTFTPLFENVVLTIIANHDYDFKNLNNSKMISSEERKNIFSNVGSTFIYKIGTTVLNSTDNIIISGMIGTIIVGYYSNYVMVISALQGIISIIISSIIPIIGAINAENDKPKLERTFFLLLFIFAFINTTCTICLKDSLQSIIFIWTKNSDYLLSERDLMLIIINFYIGNMVNPVWMYREACGLFKEVRYIMLFTAGANIILSLLFCKFLGLGGIVVATGISRMITMNWYEPKILFRKIFDKNTNRYWVRQFEYILIFSVCLIISRYLPNISGYLMINIMVRCVLISSISFLFYYAIFHNSNEIGTIKTIIRSKIMKR